VLLLVLTAFLYIFYVFGNKPKGTNATKEEFQNMMFYFSFNFCSFWHNDFIVIDGPWITFAILYQKGV
jgi:hypothetical protein